jgi:hypothetical protein
MVSATRELAWRALVTFVRGKSRVSRRVAVGALAIGVAWHTRSAGAEAGSKEQASSETSSNLAADSPGVELEWRAPPECPDLATVKRRIEGLLGQPLDVPRRQRVKVHATVHRNQQGHFELLLSLTSNGHITDDKLLARQCAALGDAAALKAALATDPIATARAIEVSTLNAGPRADRASTGTELARELEAPQSKAESGVRLFAGAAAGPLPGIALGTGLSLWSQRSVWRGEFGVQGLWGQPARYPAMPSVGAHLQLFTGIVRGCPVLGAGNVELPICIGFEGGVMRAEGFGLERAETSSRWWGALVLSQGIDVRVSARLSFWLEAGGVGSLLKPRFYVQNLGDLYAAPALSGRLWAGCEIRWAR